MLFRSALGHTWNIADVPITPHKAILAIPGATKIYDVFRSSGRFVWPIAYSTTIWVFHRLNCFNLHRTIIPLVVLLQLFDSNLKSIYRQGTAYSNILASRDGFAEWSDQNSDLVDQIEAANGFIVGQVACNPGLPCLGSQFVKVHTTAIVTDYQPHVSAIVLGGKFDVPLSRLPL